MNNIINLLGKRFTAAVLICSLLGLFWVLCPCSCRSVPRQVLEKKEFKKMQILAQYIEDYKKEYGNLPKDIYELSEKNPWISRYGLISETNDKTTLKKNQIKDVSGSSLILEVEFSWEMDGFIWAKTTTGDILKLYREN